jgi:hypothetical protein
MKINHLTFTTSLFLVFFTTGFTQVPNYVPTNGLVLWWPFTGNANDLSGNGNNGAVNGATLTTDRFGVANRAYYFSGSNCGPRIDANVNTTSIQTGLTISLWLARIGDGCQGPRIFEFYPGYDGPGSSQWGWGNGSPPIIGMGSTTSSNFNCGYPMPGGGLGEWIHIVYTNDGQHGRFYKNGSLIASVPSSGNPILASSLAFGRMNHPAWDAFNGKLDDFGVWNRALSNCEVQSLYQSQIVSGTATIIPQGSTAFCQGGSVNLTASQGSTYLWSNGQTTQSISATNSGSYTVQVTDANGCVETSTPIQVTVNPNPQVTISNSNPTTFCQGSSVTLTSTGASSYQWSNNQSTDSISVNNSGGFYTIGTDVNGCSDTSNTISVVVNPNPQATISNSGPSTFCQGGTVILNSSGASSYQWSNNQSTNSISVNSSGSFYAIGTDTNGCSDTSNTISVVVNPSPQVTISNSNPTTFCQGGSVTLASIGASSYLWSNNQSGNSISVNTSGSFYTIGTDVNGCSDTSNTISVVVNPNPQVTITSSGPTTFCSGGTVTLTSTGASSYQWSNNQSGNSISVNFSGSFYTIGTDVNGCSDSSNTISVVVNPNPTAVITASGLTSFCLGDSVLLNGVQGLNNTWSNGQTGNSFWVFQSGVYQLQVIDGNGCQDSSSVQINVFPIPQLFISLQGDDAFCQGDSTTLIGSGSITYLWSTGDTTSSIQVNTSGLYSFLGTDVNGCTSSSNQIPISVIDYPVILTQPQDIQELLGNNVVFSIGTQNTSNSFQWEGDLGLGFQTINNGGQYGMSTTNQLTVSNITQNNNGQLFRCVVTNDICSVVSDTAILTIKPNSGILNFSGGFTLNPNPTQNNLTIQFHDPINSNYSLLDITGKELRIGKIEGKELTISVQSLPVGVYFIRMDGKQIRFIRN